MLISEILAFPVSIEHSFNARLIRYFFPVWSLPSFFAFVKIV